MDEEIRQRVLGLEVQAAKIWTRLVEIGGVVWGDDRTRDNGLRSRVESLEASRAEQAERLSAQQEERRHYIDVERRKTCHGIAALKDHEDEFLKRLEEEVPVRVAEIQARSQTKAEWIKANAGIIVQTMVFVLGLLALYFKK